MTKMPKMVKKGSKIVKNGQKWPKMAKNPYFGPKTPKMPKKTQKWPKCAKLGSEKDTFLLEALWEIAFWERINHLLKETPLPPKNGQKSDIFDLFGGMAVAMLMQ
jgi:hypothetical protein